MLPVREYQKSYKAWRMPACVWVYFFLVKREKLACVRWRGAMEVDGVFAEMIKCSDSYHQGDLVSHGSSPDFSRGLSWQWASWYLSRNFFSCFGTCLAISLSYLSQFVFHTPVELWRIMRHSPSRLFREQADNVIFEKQGHAFEWKMTRHQAKLVAQHQNKNCGVHRTLSSALARLGKKQ